MTTIGIKNLTIRELNEFDFAQVSVIDRASYSESWKRSQWKKAKDLLNCNVIEIKEVVVGFIAINDSLEIIRLAIDPVYRRNGYGSRLIIDANVVKVPEINLPAQLFFRANNFRWVSTTGEYYTMKRFGNGS